MQIEAIEKHTTIDLVVERITPSQRENAYGRKLHKAILKAIQEHGAELAMGQHMQIILKRLKA